MSVAYFCQFKFIANEHVRISHCLLFEPLIRSLLTHTIRFSAEKFQ